MSDINNQQLISCSNKLLSHNFITEDPLLTISPHSTLINCCTYNHNNQVVATSAHDGNINLLNSKSFTILALLDQLNQANTGNKINSHSFSPNSRYLAIASSSNNIPLFDLKQKEITKTFKGHISSVNCVEFGVDDTIIASGSSSGIVNIHKMTSILPSIEFNDQQGQKIDKVRFSKLSPEVIACGGDAGIVQAWDINKEITICKFDNHSALIKGLEFSHVNNMLLCSNSLDRKIIF
jgi:WD40 repeat protein